MESVDRKVGKRIRTARENAGLTQVELSDLLGLTKSGYNPYEQGKIRLSIDVIFRLSEILGRSVGWFLGLESDLTEDEDALLTAYRDIDAEPVRRVVLGIVQQHARLSRDQRGD